MLSEKIVTHRTNVWLLNTGWNGGSYGEGARIKLSYTRAILDAIHSGKLQHAPTRPDPVFNTSVVTECPEVPADILIPKRTWMDPAAYDRTAQKLAGLFQQNFKSYSEGVTEEVRNAGPRG
jgi:phosphoenolpyruvate carboxykinase (ATP)